MTTPSTWLRPSNLDKLLQCGHYRPDLVSGPAAERGTRMDAAFRALIAGDSAPLGNLLPDEQAGVRWAVDTARQYAAGAALIADEAELRVAIPRLERDGTADLLCPEGGWSADLKGGQIRSYLAQQAAYALGFMDAYFLQEWTVYLLYADKRETTLLHFTRERAEQIVTDALAAANGDAAPEPNDYCGWCAARLECPARREALGIVPIEGAQAVDVATAPSELLVEFCRRAGVVEDFADSARAEIKRRVEAGERIAGASVGTRKGTRKVAAEWLGLHASRLGIGDLLSAYGPLSAEKALEIVARKMPGTTVPDDAVIEAPSATYLKISTNKPKQKTNA